MCRCTMGFPGSSVVKNLLANAGDPDLIPGSGRSPGDLQPTPVFLLGKSHSQGSLTSWHKVLVKHDQ